MQQNSSPVCKSIRSANGAVGISYSVLTIHPSCECFGSRICDLAQQKHSIFLRKSRHENLWFLSETRENLKGELTHSAFGWTRAFAHSSDWFQWSDQSWHQDSPVQGKDLNDICRNCQSWVLSLTVLFRFFWYLFTSSRSAIFQMIMPGIPGAGMAEPSLIVDCAEWLHFCRKLVHKRCFRELGSSHLPRDCHFILDFSTDPEIFQISWSSRRERTDWTAVPFSQIRRWKSWIVF